MPGQPLYILRLNVAIMPTPELHELVADAVAPLDRPGLRAFMPTPGELNLSGTASDLRQWAEARGHAPLDFAPYEPGHGRYAYLTD